ncbi:MAG: lytic transglycosylase domain-containing protein [Patescibacteria group bacterium]|jgi:soluble lytic murein transglycosylase
MKRVIFKFISTLIILGLAAAGGYYYYQTWRYPLKYQDEVKAAAIQNNLPKNFIMSVIREESRFNPDAKSNAGAVGLMQVLPTSAKWMATKRGKTLDLSTLNDPKVNIDYGCWYLSYLLKTFNGNYTTTIEAYNAGMANVTEWEKVQSGYIAFPETAEFVKRVKQSNEIYDKLYGENWDASRYDITRVLR